MQLQLDTLKHNIGAGRPNRETLLRRSLELQLAWYCEPPTDPDIEAALWPRIEQAVAALEQHQQATAETAKNRSERSERPPKETAKTTAPTDGTSDPAAERLGWSASKPRQTPALSSPDSGYNRTSTVMATKSDNGRLPIARSDCANRGGDSTPALGPKD